MAEDRAQWKAAMETADVLCPPLKGAAACPRCLRPLKPEERRWTTCWQCGHEHGATLAKVTPITYGSAGTRPWRFYSDTKFENGTKERLATFVSGIGAMLSLAIEADYPNFS